MNARSLNVDLEGLSKRYADVVKLAKSAGAKLTYRYKTKKSIQEVLATGAVEQLQTYQRLYGILKTAWEKKVIDGISSPASDDEYYGELSELQNSMEALTYRNTALGRAMSLSCELNEHKQRLSHKIACHGNANGTTIYL